MKGTCLCKGIVIKAPDHTAVDVCHCTMCRRWGGGPMLAIHCRSNVEFEGDLQPATYRSSDWAERGFCPTCGTHLFYHLLPSDDYMLPAGLFQQVEGLHLTSQIFVDEKADYYDFANQTPTMTGDEVFAQFGADE